MEIYDLGLMIYDWEASAGGEAREREARAFVQIINPQS
jgi:hypothetical protein